MTDTTATAADVAQGSYFYTSAGVRTIGTAGSGSGDTYTLTTVAPEQTFTAVESTNNSYQAELTMENALEDGESYIITYDGEMYAGECALMFGTDLMVGCMSAF